MKEIIFAIFFAIICCKVSARNERSIGGRIVGGTEIEIEAIPFQVSVRFYDSHICGGSILSARFVLTAAHCTYPFTKIGFSIRAGSTNKDEGGSVHTVSKITDHPRFDPIMFDYDASILTLLNHIAFDKFRQPIKLPYFGEITKLGALVATSGWGLTMNQNETNINLRIAELRISEQDECNETYIYDGGITKRMVCAYSAGRDSCDGGN